MFHNKNEKTELDQQSTHLTLSSAQLSTPCGSMIAIADHNALYFLGFASRNTLQYDIEQILKKTDATLIEGTTAPIDSIQKELYDYFKGIVRTFKTPLHFVGSPFQEIVWHALQKIPYGETISYATLAKNINKPSAFRAVANANATNPFSIVVPCHRVIQKSGAFGGYNGGIICKQWLLEHEKKY